MAFSLSRRNTVGSCLAYVHACRASGEVRSNVVSWFCNGGLGSMFSHWHDPSFFCISEGLGTLSY